jgi:Tfp pilus assembly protein PilV
MRKAFTLLEVLIAAGVLFVVSSAVVGLSNSIIQNTGTNANRVVADRWATEGLELVGKIRDESVKNGVQVNGETVWFAPAYQASSYGWYYLNSAGQLVARSSQSTTLSIKDLLSAPTTPSDVEVKQSDKLTAYRLICVEAAGAVSQNDRNATDKDDVLRCNTSSATSQNAVDDGSRQTSAQCNSGDAYCLMTQASLGRNAVTARIIPAGSAVKVRSVVIWTEKSAPQRADLAELLTNWKGQTENL